VAVLADCERTGIAADVDHLVELETRLRDQVKAAAQEAYDTVGHEFHLGSPKQLQALLFDELGLPKTKKIKTGWTTDADALQNLIGTHPVIEALLLHREMTRLLMVVEKQLLPTVAEDGRIHTTFKQMIAATGRLSSDNPNLQNVPIRTAQGREIRQGFVAGPGFEALMTADYSQIEMRIMAHLSDDAGLKEAFSTGEDLHTFVASRAFGVPVEQVDPELRRRVKAMSYGLAYGLSAFGLATQLRIPTDEAKEQMNAYFERFGGIRDYLRDVVAQARKDGYTSTLLDRRRYLPDLTSDNGQRRQMAERMALNAPIQGSAADIIKLAMLGVHRALREQGLRSRCCCRCTTSSCSRWRRGSGRRSRRWSGARWAGLPADGAARRQRRRRRHLGRGGALAVAPPTSSGDPQHSGAVDPPETDDPRAGWSSDQCGDARPGGVRDVAVRRRGRGQQARRRPGQPVEGDQGSAGARRQPLHREDERPEGEQEGGQRAEAHQPQPPLRRSAARSDEHARAEHERADDPRAGERRVEALCHPHGAHQCQRRSGDRQAVHHPGGGPEPPGHGEQHQRGQQERQAAGSAIQDEQRAVDDDVVPPGLVVADVLAEGLQELERPVHRPQQSGQHRRECPPARTPDRDAQDQHGPRDEQRGGHERVLEQVEADGRRDAAGGELAQGLVADPRPEVPDACAARGRRRAGRRRSRGPVRPGRRAAARRSAADAASRRGRPPAGRAAPRCRTAPAAEDRPGHLRPPRRGTRSRPRARRTRRRRGTRPGRRRSTTR
jgi:hypothetical protein